MEELSDKDFDQIFKNRIAASYPEYEEESWLKMEKKLRKRDRVVFFRNASIILLFLSFGIGIYLGSDKKSVITKVKTAKKTEQVKETEDKKVIDSPNSSQDLTRTLASRNEYAHDNFILAKKNKVTLSIHKNPKITSKSEVSITDKNTTIDSTTRIVQNQISPQNAQTIIAQEPANPTINEVLINKKLDGAEKKDTKKTKFPITLSIHVGPDFNSTENAIGGKGGMAMGVGIGVGLNKRLSLQTGINYGSKNYKAQGYDYAFSNPNTVNIISGIDASCKVLEIPLRVGYILMDHSKNSIDLNAGLSSYIMLKENYRFMYTAVSGRKDRFLEKKNANEHYLSVIDLSATYNIKLRNKKFALGIQPYVKIPIAGIGEGNVPLKSSGISLKLNYELSKKK